MEDYSHIIKHLLTKHLKDKYLFVSNENDDVKFIIGTQPRRISMPLSPLMPQPYMTKIILHYKTINDYLRGQSEMKSWIWEQAISLIYGVNYINDISTISNITRYIDQELKSILNPILMKDNVDIPEITDYIEPPKFKYPVGYGGKAHAIFLTEKSHKIINLADNNITTTKSNDDINNT